MDSQPVREFGQRRSLPPVEPKGPVKRSGHVALLLMGTLAVGGGAYALMPRGGCGPAASGPAIPSDAPGRGDCGSGTFTSAGGSRSSGASRYGIFGDAFSRRTLWGLLVGSGPDRVTRGGFGSFARAFSAHFSGGG